MKINNDFFRSIVLLTFFSCADQTTKGQVNSRPKNYDINSFEAIIVNSDYSMAYSIQTILTHKQLKIIFKSGLVGEKDSVLFSNSLQPSDTLQQISEINLSTLKGYYSNNCIEDGSQVTVTLKKGNDIKSVHLSNYYQEDIGKIIYLVNSLVPDKYKVWYDKEKLIADYKKCNGN